jgi:hypothetical protein
MSDELVDGILAEANGIAIEPKAADDEDLRIPVGTTYQTGAGVVETYRTVSQMQANILSWASTLSPAYQNYAQKMIDAGFMPESYRAQPTNAASAVLYPAKVFAAYKANGGELAFNEWFDWYSQTAKAYRDANDPNRGGGRKPSYMNKEDVQTMADTAARAGIGRGLTDKESKEALQAVRKGEKQNFFDNEDISVEERRQILQQVVSDNPEFLPYQFDTTVLDAMASVIQRGEEFRNG